jgi:hypothetical protein
VLYVGAEEEMIRPSRWRESLGYIGGIISNQETGKGIGGGTNVDGAIG